MAGPKYKRLADLDEEADIYRVSGDGNSLWSALSGFLLLFAFVACMIFLTSVQSHPGSTRAVGKSSPPKTTKRNISSFQDYYFTQEESRFLNCSDLIKGDNDAIALYVNNGRMKLYRERVFELPMDCESIRQRIYGDMPPFRPLKRPIAFVRTIYKLYELQEALLSISYHPDNVFCYVMDSKSTEKLKNAMRTVGQCFENVMVLEKEYSLNSGGHGQDPAHFDCLQRILNKKWYHAVILQNYDLVIKSPQQLSDLSESLNYTSIMGFDFGFSPRYDTKADWTPHGMGLFKNETGVSPEILHRKMVVRKSLNEVIISKVFVKAMIEKLNMDVILKLFDDNNYYGVDEMLVQTLYENYLGLEGQMESNCTRNHGDNLTRMTHWDFSGPNGFDKECHSKWKRHGICILGVEYLRELAGSQKVIANKVMSDFDFGTILCTREMMKRNVTGSNPDAHWLSSFPQFREMQMKANGTYDRNKFDFSTAFSSSASSISPPETAITCKVDSCDGDEKGAIIRNQRPARICRLISFGLPKLSSSDARSQSFVALFFLATTWGESTTVSSRHSFAPSTDSLVILLLQMPSVVIAGAGLVGALNACFFAQKGWDVTVYEYRKDIRTMQHVHGRSINLALSNRGKAALEAVGLEKYIVNQGVPLYARLVHNKDGKTFSRQPYGLPGEHIVSINRRHLNEVMITQAEKCPNVKFYFEHKVKSVDYEKKQLVVQCTTPRSRIPSFGSKAPPLQEHPEIHVEADLIIACDGAYSAVRKSLMSNPRFDFSQEYIEHGYVELNILTNNNDFAFEENVFHLWPRGHFTLIALANKDKTFTVTIFAPFSEFEKHMSNTEDVLSFFNENFPDAFKLLGKEHIAETFNRVKPQPLVSIKCSPHSFFDNLVLMGDSAHAMVPFYGQGMNCGFEDCLVFSQILDKHGEDIGAAVHEYSETRVKDAHSINDLAMYNYEELKDLVNRNSYKLRKKFDMFMHRIFANSWIPLYSMVTFSQIPYSEVMERRKRQDRIVSRLVTLASTVALIGTAVGVYASRGRIGL